MELGKWGLLSTENWAAQLPIRVTTRTKIFNSFEGLKGNRSKLTKQMFFTLNPLNYEALMSQVKHFFREKFSSLKLVMTRG